jgi:WD40 repeat protein
MRTWNLFSKGAGVEEGVVKMFSHHDALTAMCALGTGSVLSASRDGVIKLWSASPSEGPCGDLRLSFVTSVRHSEVKAQVTSLSATSDLVLSSSADLSLRLWSVTEGGENLRP